MELDKQMKEELWDLCWLLKENQINSEQADRLEYLVISNVKARQFYVNLHEMYAIAEWDLSEVKLSNDRNYGTSFELENSLEHRSTILQILSGSISKIKGFLMKPSQLSIIASMLVLTAGLVLMSLTYLHKKTSISTTNSDKLLTESKPLAIGRITNLRDCVWADEHLMRISGDNIQQGELLDLKSGLIEITFDNDIEVLLQGPIRYRVNGPEAGTLLQGNITAYVPDPKLNFSINTSSAQVIDLGTEFGVRVNDDQSTFIHVYSGRVEVKAKDSQGKVIEKSVRLLKMGESVDVKLAVTTDSPSTQNPFVRVNELKLYNGHQRWLEFSQNLRKDSDIVAYYKFTGENDSGKKLINYSKVTQGQFDGVLGNGRQSSTLPKWTAGRWPKKSALHFDGIKDQKVVIHKKLSLVGNQSLSVEAWIRCTKKAGVETVRIIDANSNLFKNRKGFFLVVAGKWRHPEGLAAFGIGNIEAISHKRVDDGNWHHVVGTFGKGKIRVFIDGVAGAEVDYEGTVMDSNEPFGIGNKAVAGGRGFTGLIGEVVIYKRQLTRHEIRLHYRTGRAGLSR